MKLRTRDFVLVGCVLLVIAVLYFVLSRHGSATAQSRAIDPMAAQHGQQLYMKSCAVCHGQSAQGMPHQGIDLRSSKMIAMGSDAEIVDFIRVGRLPNDPKSVTGLYMPPKGGNTTLQDDHLADIVAFLRTIQQQQRKVANVAE